MLSELLVEKSTDHNVFYHRLFQNHWLFHRKPRLGPRLIATSAGYSLNGQMIQRQATSLVLRQRGSRHSPFSQHGLIQYYEVMASREAEHGVGVRISKRYDVSYFSDFTCWSQSPLTKSTEVDRRRTWNWSIFRWSQLGSSGGNGLSNDVSYICTYLYVCLSVYLSVCV